MPSKINISYTYGSRENVCGFCQEFGFGSINTHHESLTFFVFCSQCLENSTAELCLVTTYSNDGRMPRRTVCESGPNLPRAKGDLPAPAMDSIRYLAMFSLAKNRRVVSGMARDCKRC